MPNEIFQVEALIQQTEFVSIVQAEVVHDIHRFSLDIELESFGV